MRLLADGIAEVSLVGSCAKQAYQWMEIQCEIGGSGRVEMLFGRCRIVVKPQGCSSIEMRVEGRASRPPTWRKPGTKYFGWFENGRNRGV